MDQPPLKDDASKAVLENFLRVCSLEISSKQITKLLNFCALILRWNRVTNLVQADSVQQLIKSHVIDCLAAAGEICGPNVVDVGSGAGFPGIVFATVLPDWHFYLVETNQRRARFLTQVKIELSLDNVTVVNARIEDWVPETRIDCVTSRAYSALDLFYKGCRHISVEKNASNLRFVALKGRVEQAELAALIGEGIPEKRIIIKPLQVPDREHRHVVLF